MAQQTGVPSVDVSSGAGGPAKEPRQNIAGNTRARGEPPPGITSDRPQQSKKPSAGFAKAMQAVTGSASKPAKSQHASGKPARSSLPDSVESPEDSPELENEAETEAQKQADAVSSRLSGKQKLDALRNKDHAKPAPQEPAPPAEDDDEEAQQTQEATAEEDDAGPAQATAAGEAPVLSPAERTALNTYIRRFGLTNIPLDLVAQARDSHLDQFAQIVGGQANGLPPGGQPAGPAAGMSQQGGQPHQASGPSLTPARTPASGQPPILDDATLSAATDAFGPEFKPFAEAFRGIQAQLQEVNAWKEQQTRVSQARDQQAAHKLVNDFFGNKARAGFTDQLGTQAKGISQGQHQVRAAIVKNAVAYSNAMASQGNPVSDDEALELSFQHVFRDQNTAQARQQGRQDVHQQVISRHRQTSLPGGTGTRNGAKGSTATALNGAISRFLNTSR